MAASPAPKFVEPEARGRRLSAVPSGDDPSFERLRAGLEAARPPARRRASGAAVSALVHAALIVSALLFPFLFHEGLPEPQGSLPVFFYDPPPPPPPPLARGSGLAPGRQAHEPAVPREPPSKPPLVLPEAPSPPEPRPTPETLAPLGPPGGDLEGSDAGVPEGMLGGVEGGVVGGVPGGVLGGVLGGTGTGPVPVRDADRPPRPVRMPRPLYPPEAFAKKVAGVVVLEILIDEHGRVVRARVLQSIPLLDQAAVEAVHRWAFVPAQKGGRPVAVLARAPITFTIY